MLKWGKKRENKLDWIVPLAAFLPKPSNLTDTDQSCHESPWISVNMSFIHVCVWVLGFSDSVLGSATPLFTNNVFLSILIKLWSLTEGKMCSGEHWAYHANYHIL